MSYNGLQMIIATQEPNYKASYQSFHFFIVYIN
jgi:hypothetical protein